MATEFQTSFIPKQSQQPRTGSRHLSSGNFFFILTALIFLGVMGFTGAVFVWTKYTKSNIESLDKQLRQTQEQYDRNFIETASRLNTRIETSKRLLSKHVAMSGIVNFLENTTSRDIALTSLDITKNIDETIVMTAQGVALDYPSIVAQSDAYGQGSLIKDLIFSGLNANDAGLITFRLESTVDPKLVDYNTLVAGVVDAEGSNQQRTQQTQQQQSQADGSTEATGTSTTQ